MSQRKKVRIIVTVTRVADVIVTKKKCDCNKSYSNSASYGDRSNRLHGDNDNDEGDNYINVNYNAKSNTNKNIIFAPHYMKFNENNKNNTSGEESNETPNVTTNCSKPASLNPTPSGYTPLQISTAYGFPTQSTPLTINNTKITGAGQIIALIDAYGYPNALSDLQTFCTKYSLSQPTQISNITKVNLLATPASGHFNFGIYNPAGTPSADTTGWSLEQALDIQWAHALAPQATILLVQSQNSNYSSLLGAVTSAVNIGATVISMSWGGSEASSETSYDSYFSSNAAANASTPVTFIASAGDSLGVEYPSASPYVLSVGGTTLSINGSSARTSEKAWYNSQSSSTGGGVSKYEAQPSYQTNAGINTKVSNSGKKRISNDVSFDADPNSGVPIYDSYLYQRNINLGWVQIGGTSLSSPCWAAITALANQARSVSSKGPLSTNKLQTGIYTLYKNGTTATNGYTYASCFYDVTTSGNQSKEPTNVAYDYPTGLGVPIVSNLVKYLVTL